MTPPMRATIRRAGRAALAVALVAALGATTALPSALVVGLVANAVGLALVARRRAGQAGGAMATGFVPVPDLAALDDLLPRAGVVLFLHAPRCRISRRAYDRLARLGGEVALVDVSRDHDVKRAIAARTGVRHASPQVIVLRGGRPLWSASHRAITAAAVGRARDAAASVLRPSSPTTSADGMARIA